MKIIAALLLSAAVAGPAFAQAAAPAQPVLATPVPAAGAVWTDNEFIQAHTCEALEPAMGEAPNPWVSLIAGQSTGRTPVTQTVAKEEGRAAAALLARARSGDSQAERTLVAERSACAALKRPAVGAAASAPRPAAPGPSNP